MGVTKCCKMLKTSSHAGLDQLRQVRAVHRQPWQAAEVPADLRGGQQEPEKLRGEGGASDAARVLERLWEGVRIRQHDGESEEAATREGEEEEKADGRGRGKSSTEELVYNTALWCETEDGRPQKDIYSDGLVLFQYCWHFVFILDFELLSLYSIRINWWTVFDK